MDGIQRTLSHDKYTVGWICALPLELTAAKAMLEKRHERLPQPPTDRNTYALGEIFGHNVVLACLPEYGTVCAAAVATQMLSTFPAIRFGLMVGIGGGVPGITVDIRLGDIVVSYPTGDSGGVIQYDYGKTIAGGRFVRTGRLNQPPEALLTAVNELRSEHRLRPTRILEFVDQVRRAHPQLAKSLDVDRMGDDLFAVESDHVPGEDTCQNCDRRMIVRRKARKSDDPVIHYGLIASGNQVVKDARTRERYANELGILCFEMEAAGLMNHFPCLVIRGICDYSDSHKSKSWQEYAAVMAAAFAKELLSVASVPLVKETQKATRKISPAVFGTNDPSLYLALSQQPQWLLTRKKSSKSHIFDRLSTYEHDRIHRVHLWNVCPGTTEWILTDNKFETWLEGSSNPCLWLTGLIGSGKTLVTSAAIECMKNGTLEPRIFVAHFFYSHSNQSRLSARHAFESYAKQIIGYLDMIQKPCPEHVISCVKRFYGPKQDVPSFLEIMHGIILPLCEILPGLVLVVDGLDECEQGEVLLVCEGIRLVLKMNSTRVLISGRESLAVTDRIQGSAKINLSEREGRSDIIRKFIEWKIDNKMRERSITERTSVLQTIKDRLFEKAGNMILWASLQLDIIWEECYTELDIKTILDDLPPDLITTYERCYAQIRTRQRELARRILPWVCVTPRPFRGEELQQALAVNRGTGSIDTSKLVPVKELVRSCAHLVVWDTNGDILLAHYSVHQFLARRRPDDLASMDQPNYSFQDAHEELASLCVSHLISLPLTPRRKTNRLSINTRPLVQTLLKHTPYSNLLGSKIKNTAQIPWPVSITAATDQEMLPVFFEFARGQWAPLTKDVSWASESFKAKFQQLALEPDLTWGIHPWRPLGISRESHFAGLLGYAIVNCHELLLNALLACPTVRPKTFTSPLPQYNNLPPLHLAARVGFHIFVDLTSDKCKLAAVDRDRRTALHHAAEACCDDFVASVSKNMEWRSTMDRFSSKFDRSDYQGNTPLHLAAANGSSRIVMFLVDSHFHPNTTNSAGQTPVMLSRLNNHPEVTNFLSTGIRTSEGIPRRTFQSPFSYPKTTPSSPSITNPNVPIAFPP